MAVRLGFYYSVYFTNHCDYTFWQKTCQKLFFHPFKTSLTMNIERKKSEVMLKRLQRYVVYTLPSRFRRLCRTYFYIRRWVTPNMIKNTFRYQMCNKWLTCKAPPLVHSHKSVMTSICDAHKYITLNNKNLIKPQKLIIIALPKSLKGFSIHRKKCDWDAQF